ncbi:MAG: hypothetical protein HXY48_03955 [Ignavibacteriaceae bacterium]|nr:hypothetical protein [Ignavibacteriaceae bacterium]
MFSHNAENSTLKKNIFALVVVLSQLNFTPLLNAQDYFKPNMGDALRVSISGQIYDARTLSMGNSNSVFNDTYTATLLNPATLGLARKFTVNTSVGTNLYNNEAFFISDSVLSQRTETVLYQLGLVIPLTSDSASNNFAISIGYNRSKDFNRILKFSGFNSTNTSLIQDLTSVNSYLPRELLLSYPEFDPGSNEYLGDRTIFNGNLNQEGYVLEEGGINHWSFGVAGELAYNIFFGASFNYNVGSYLRDGEFTESDSRNTYPDSIRTIGNNPLTAGFQSFYINDIKDWVFNGYDLRIGVLYKFFNFIGIGGSVKTPSVISVTENHYFKGKSQFATEYFAEVDTVIENKFTIQSPYEFSVAADVNLWIITGTAEITYIDYTQMKFSGDLEVPEQSALNKKIIDTYTQTFNAKIGAEFRLPFTGLSARAGAMYIPYPVAESPTEFDRKFLTAGLGIRSGEGAMEFNIAYVYGFWDHVAEDYGSSIQSIRQSIISQNILASLSLRF